MRPSSEDQLVRRIHEWLLCRLYQHHTPFPAQQTHISPANRVHQLQGGLPPAKIRGRDQKLPRNPASAAAKVGQLLDHVRLAARILSNVAHMGSKSPLAHGQLKKNPSGIDGRRRRSGRSHRSHTHAVRARTSSAPSGEIPPQLYQYVECF